MLRSLLLFVVLLVLPGVVAAHESGASYEEEVSSYVVDVGYTAPPTPGTPVSFDFNLRAQDNDVAFDGVWVRIEQEGGAVFLATGVHADDFGGARLLYRFAEPGTYRIHVRYESGTSTLAETTFPLEVSEGPMQETPRPYGWLLGGVGLGVVATCALLYSRRLRQKFRSPQSGPTQ